MGGFGLGASRRRCGGYDAVERPAELWLQWGGAYGKITPPGARPLPWTDWWGNLRNWLGFEWLSLGFQNRGSGGLSFPP